MKNFLTARWQDLIMVNYEIDPAILANLIPPGTGLDFHEGRCFVSLVGFMFLNTRVLGIPIPFHTNFEEVNLRFYVERKTADDVRRGVVFVKEIVPRYAIAAVARIFYEEPYEAWKMGHTKSGNEISYSWQKGGNLNRICVEIGANLGIPAADSYGEFIIEHYWGYTKRVGGRTDEYKVEHPKWELFSVKNSIIDVDFAAVYGGEFALLRDQKPYSVLLAKGSEITVYKGEKIL
ncbi:MAG: DUF2071 domain-containing protein [Saprospiraceae bacterium]|nr:DUF2071 domain-containing protein [Pyrinomonadaceae bacterium]